MSRKNRTEQPKVATGQRNNKFRLDFLNAAQQMAYTTYQQHDVMFMLGPAGTGKTHMAVAFAISEIIMPSATKKKIILTRPIVESGENLGFLPGDIAEKVDPYMQPFMDCLDVLVGDPAQKERIEAAVDVRPLAFMRGCTFHDSVCILDEAQNCTKKQLKLFLSRFGNNSKIIITGDPKQSDLRGEEVPLVDVVHRLETVPGIGMVQFKAESIVRHPLVAAIIERLEE